MAASLFSQPPIAYFQPLDSPPHTCQPSFISCEPSSGCRSPPAGGGSGSLPEFETISSKVCGWAGELRKDHDLRQPRSDHCAWLFSEQAAPFHGGAELPSSSLISTAQRQPCVDFLSSAAAMKNIFRAACSEESDVGVMVHRLGDWLVLDDGTEIPACIGAQPRRRGKDKLLEVQRRRAEQRHTAAVARAEAAEARAGEAHRRLEEARAALWRAEEDARLAQEALREAVADAAQAAEDRDRLCAGQQPQQQPQQQRPQQRATCAGDGGAVGQEHQCQEDQALPGRGVSLDVEVDAPEELQLYRNFLGHSIRLLQDEPARVAADAPPPAAPRGELVALDGPAAAFRQVGVWKIADDASVVVGSRTLCLGNAEHPKLTLFLHSTNVLSDMQLLEHWVECVIAGVPEFAICFHRDGAVQSYRLYNVSELGDFLEERLAIGQKLQMTLEILRWIKRQCCFEGCTYWLSKSKNEPTLKLFNLSGTAATTARDSVKLDQAIVCMDASLNRELVLKNTFLHVHEVDDIDETVSLRRTQSCPARCYSWVDTEEVEVPRTSLSLPLRKRVSALFFRRAVSLPPGTDASRFFQLALDLEASGASPRRGDLPERRLLLQSCCHLGLAICELTLLQRPPGSGGGGGGQRRRRSWAAA
mmetsp:Transcript_23365/g.59013  ORF Transcript_23365/g.59013 Transcript_23365/m.59013 type:complete len:645 (+) Transcript_23365:24-1958(+)